MWALVFALTGVLGFVAVRAPSTGNWTNWVIPVVVIVGAVGNDADLPEAGPRARRAAASDG